MRCQLWSGCPNTGFEIRDGSLILQPDGALSSGRMPQGVQEIISTWSAARERASHPSHAKLFPAKFSQAKSSQAKSQARSSQAKSYRLRSRSASSWVRSRHSLGFRIPPAAGSIVNIACQRGQP
jgi:hypothetical protein